MIQVTLDKTAKAVGSGDLEVFATPMMIALMENEAMKVAQQFCQDGETTVGIFISVNHTRATPVGEYVKAQAKVIQNEGRKITFEVVASDENGEIGSGTHSRFVVDKKKFMSKL